MSTYGSDAINELLVTSLDVTNSPQHLPGMVGVNQGAQGFGTVYPSGSRQGKSFNPGHALIVVETGLVRVTADGITTPDAGIGQLYGIGTPNGPVIDYLSVLGDYQALLKNFLVVLQSGTTAHLTISYRN